MGKRKFTWAFEGREAAERPLADLGESIVKQTDFALSLAKHVISTSADGENFVFSPLSMHVVLSMVAAGSSGPTRAQFLDFLKSKSVEELNSLSSRVKSLLFAEGGPLSGPLDGPRLSFANGVWVHQTLTLKPAFKEIVQNVYKAASYPADFVNKQKIVIRVSMHSQKRRSKAMTIAVNIPGIESVEIVGEDKDQLVVIGDGVDSVELTRRQRKKLAHAELVSLTEAKKKEETKPKKPEDDKHHRRRGVICSHRHRPTTTTE